MTRQALRGLFSFVLPDRGDYTSVIGEVLNEGERMSRNSKNAKRTIERNARKRATQQGKTIVSNGPNGPKTTTPKHGKRNAWWQKGRKSDNRAATADV